MVVDTSAVVAILLSKPDGKRMIQAMDGADSLQMSAASVLEASIVLESRFGGVGREALDSWLESSAIEIVAVTLAQVEVARRGFRRFGKGRHRAALNYGDCFSYGLAITLGETLLFCGNDFSSTDVRKVAPIQ